MQKFLVSLIAITWCFWNASYAVCPQQHCMIVIDAGSSGSRAHFFSYDLDNSKTPIAINERWAKAIVPGLSSLSADSKTINSYLNDLLAETPEGSYPVYFYATAGMRLLSPAKQQNYYTLVKQGFKQFPHLNLLEVKTITGSEEGIYGWLAVNYPLGTLAKGKDTVGQLDMGGASVQVSFLVDNTNVNNKDIHRIDLYNHSFKVFTHSFLGLGQDEVIRQSLDMASCFTKNYPLASGEVANGNVSRCKKQMNKLINKVHHSRHTVKAMLKANPVNQWYAGGSIVYLAHAKPFHFGTNFSNRDLLAQGDADVCQASWQTLSTQYAQDDRLYHYCLSSAYFYALMVDGYGIDPKVQINLNADADWPLGVVLKLGALS